MLIYKVTSPSGKYYIGQTTRTLEERKKQHHTLANRDNTLPFYRAIRKHNDNLIWEIIDTASTIEELNEKEVYWIAKYDTCHGAGYNCTEGGGSNIPNAETRKKLSEQGKQREANKTVEEKVASTKKGWVTRRANGTDTHTEETKEKIRVGNKKVDMTEEEKAIDRKKRSRQGKKSWVTRRANMKKQ